MDDEREKHLRNPRVPQPLTDLWSVGNWRNISLALGDAASPDSCAKTWEFERFSKSADTASEGGRNEILRQFAKRSKFGLWRLVADARSKLGLSALVAGGRVCSDCLVVP